MEAENKEPATIMLSYLKKFLRRIIGVNTDFIEYKVRELESWRDTLFDSINSIAEIQNIEKQLDSKAHEKKIERILSWGIANKELCLKEFPKLPDKLFKHDQDFFWKKYLVMHIEGLYSYYNYR